MGLIRTWDVILMTLLHLGSRLRESGTLSVIPPYAFVMSTRTSTCRTFNYYDESEGFCYTCCIHAVLVFNKQCEDGTLVLKRSSWYVM